MKIPVMLELSGKKVVIIGGGKTAYRYIQRLKAFYASVTCVSKVFEPKIKAMKTITCVEEIIRHNDINEEHFDQVQIVIASTNNTILNERIYKYCVSKGILCLTTHKNGPKDFELMESESKNGLLLAASSMGSNEAFYSEILTTVMDTIDDETFKRLEMILEQNKLMSSLIKK